MGWVVARMSGVSDKIVSGKSGFATALALMLAVLCLGAPEAHAQSAPYWTSTLPAGFGGLTSDPSVNAFGNFTSRYNFENGWFIGSERGNLNWGLNNFTPVSAFGSPTSFSYEGSQVGYNFKSAPVSVFAGFDTVKYNSPIASPFTALDSMSSNSTPGYRVNAGVEFRPTSNLSLSVGASFSQQPNDLNSALLPGASPFGYRGR
jgi:opacity protein-like surface antigen